MDRINLKQKQALPLEQKIALSKKRIKEFYEHYDGKVYVSFSGGKDSTALLHLVRSVYPSVPALFVDTGLEYPEIKEFVRQTKNVIIVRLERCFIDVIKNEGYPVVSKKVARQIRDLQNPTEKNANSRRLYLTGEKMDGTQTKYFKLPEKWKKLINAPFKVSERCCNIMKKAPIKKFNKESGLKGFVGTMASNSHQRTQSYLKTGCNSFKQGKSMPLSFWVEQDIWDYIKKFNLPYSKIYDMGEHNTGCMFCMFGCHLEKHPNRFDRMKEHHPEIYNYCMKNLGLKEVLEYLEI